MIAPMSRGAKIVPQRAKLMIPLSPANAHCRTEEDNAYRIRCLSDEFGLAQADVRNQVRSEAIGWGQNLDRPSPKVQVYVPRP